MGLKWELDYHQKAMDEARAKENKAFHAILDLVRDLGGTKEHVDQAIGLWVDGTMATDDKGWHRRSQFEVKDKIEELRSLIDKTEDMELLK